MPRIPGSDPDLTIDAATAATRGGVPPGTPLPDRFTPGSIIAGRYRLVALLGRGGMGEVYSAEDLTLDQPVALKFLPADVGFDESPLARFHNELRTARQVSHKNVCRLYDLGESGGRRFLTMEYVDGEDLASLLRRIGRIPQDKAIQIARQLCAGVAAAHERGVLHRDLKPANVMIDGDGNVRITDFGIATGGIAGLSDVSRDPHAETRAASTPVVAGTPQYMAPEQLAGQPASVRSDIYALGLILFEIFTGRRAYDAKTLAHLKQLHDTGAVTTPSSVVPDLDPAIERVILRCLEKDPQRRPGSALAVAAALPGGDPLAAALAAGETPSPALLVAAGETEALPVLPALSAAVAVIGVLVAFAAMAPRASVAGLAPLDKPADVLMDRAEQMIAAFGYAEAPVDRARGVTIPSDPVRWAQQQGSADWWPSLRSGTPPALLFWYRTSPRDLVPDAPASSVTPTDPPLVVSGMQLAILDMRGRLVEFHSVPPQVEPTEPVASPDWPALFRAAELDFGSFTPSEPQWTPPHFADVRAAWEGASADRSDIKIRVEAAAYRGRPISFYIVAPWSRPSRMQPLVRTTAQNVMSAINVALWLGLLIGAALLSRYNLLSNRADRRGAARLAIALTLMASLAWLFAAHHVATAELELRQLILAIGFATFLGVTVWVTYLAVDPYARRLWPDGLLGWTRLLSGRVRDPRVGRDVLVGLVFASGTLLLEAAHAFLPQRWGHTAPLPPFGNSVMPIASAAFVVTRWVNGVNNALQSVLFIALIFVVLRLVLRRGWLAALAGGAILLVASDNGAALTGTWFDTVLYMLTTGLMTYSILRFGLLTAAVAAFADGVATTVPLTLQLSSWWATPSILSLALLIGLACFGFYASRAGQPLFGKLEVGN